MKCKMEYLEGGLSSVGLSLEDRRKYVKDHDIAYYKSDVAKDYVYRKLDEVDNVYHINLGFLSDRQTNKGLIVREGYFG